MLFTQENESEIISSIITIYDTDDKDDYIKLIKQINTSTQYELYIDIYQTHIEEKYVKVLYNILKNKSVVQEIQISVKNDQDDTVMLLQTQTNSYLEDNIRFQIRQREDIKDQNYFNYLKYMMYNHFNDMEVNQLFETDYYINSFEASKRKIVDQVINIQKALEFINKNF